MIRQLDVPLRTLAPNRRVYIVRNGLVYQYPARIVRDMANDMWVGPKDDEFDPSITDCAAGSRVEEHYLRGTPRNTLSALCRSTWHANGGNPTLFDHWWLSVDDESEPFIVGCAVACASHGVWTWSLFVHRNEVDTQGLNA